MLSRVAPIVALCAGLSIVLANDTASAQKKKQASNNLGSIQADCARQAGAQYRPEERRWYFYSPVGTAQWSAFYDCLDARTRKR
jgi:hypothetical protein